MALPPEPLDVVLPAAVRVVIAEVVGVEDLGAWADGDRAFAIDAAPDCPPQRARLKVGRVLRGPAMKGDELDVTKPAGPYALHTGVRGAFLVDEHGALLGRYGPDSYAPDEVEQALAAGGQR